MTTYRTLLVKLMVKKGLVVVLLALAGATGAKAQVAVVTHKSAPVDQLDARALLDIYSLEETKWDDGSRIVLFDLKGKDDLKQTFYAFLGRRPDEMKRVWLRIILSGEGRSPTQVKSTDELLDKVATTPGAIGYVPLALVTKEVKVIATIL